MADPVTRCRARSASYQLLSIAFAHPIAEITGQLADGRFQSAFAGHMETAFGRNRLAESGIETLVRLPFSPALAFASDAGRPAADGGDRQSDEAERFAALAERMVGAFAGEQSAAMSGELAESLGIDAQMAGIDDALAAQPGLDEAQVRAEIQTLIDGEVGRLGRE